LLFAGSVRVATARDKGRTSSVALPANVFPGDAREEALMPPNDGEPSWVKEMREAARQAGLGPAPGQRFEEFRERLAARGPEFMRQVAQHLAAQVAVHPDPQGLELWQRAGVAELLATVTALVTARLPTLPQTALLITLTSDAAANAAEDLGVQVAVDLGVQVTVKTPSTSPRSLRPAELVAAGKWPQVVERVDTIVPCLGYILWIGDSWPGAWRLIAWDFRGAPMHATDAQINELLARIRGVGARQPLNSPGAHARRAREALLAQVEAPEQRAALRQALADELLLDAVSRRPVLRALLQAGAPPIWDAGGAEASPGLLRRVDVALRQQHPEHTTTSSEGSQRRGERRRRGSHVPVMEEPFDEALHSMTEESTAALLPTSLPELVPAHIEKMIHARTAGLQGREREALQHRLRAQAQDVDFRTYCADRGLAYRALRRAASRGWQRLKKK
jgi:hypothetical protein